MGSVKFWDASVGESRGEEGGKKKQLGRLEKSDGLALGWKFQTGEKKKKEQWGLGCISRFPFKEERLEAHCDPRERRGRRRRRVSETGGRLDEGRGYFCFPSCLPLPFPSCRCWRLFQQSSASQPFPSLSVYSWLSLLPSVSPFTPS